MYGPGFVSRMKLGGYSRGERRAYKVDSPIDRVTDEGGFVCKFLPGGVCLFSQETKLLSGQLPMFAQMIIVGILKLGIFSLDYGDNILLDSLIGLSHQVRGYPRKSANK